MPAPGESTASLDSVETVGFDYWDDAAAEILAAGVDDPRFDPEALELAVRKVMAGWVVAVDAGSAGPADGALLEVALPETAQSILHPPDGTAGARLWVRQPLVRQVWIYHLSAAAQPPLLEIGLLVHGRRWVENAVGQVLTGERDTDEALGDLEYWNFSERWTLILGSDGVWRLSEVETGSHQEVFGYRFVSRLETAGEYEERTSSASPVAIPRARRFFISGDFSDDALHCGGSASIVVALESPPGRAEAAALLEPAMQAEMGLTLGAGEFQPRLSALESRELLD